MSPWEIWTYDFPEEGTHPCVLFTSRHRLAYPEITHVNVLLCRTLRGAANRPLKPQEVLLDRADGFDWETICRVDVIHLVKKSEIRERRGIVCFERRRLISERIYKLFPFET